MSSRHVSPPWLTVTVLAVSGMVSSLQFTLAIPVLPAMSAILHATPNDASWVVTATLLASTVATPILARLADMYGKRRMLVVVLGVMTAGSVIAALGASYPAVITGRAMQGFATALIPIGISLLRDQLPPERVSSAVALMSATLGIGSALGMPLSGVLYAGFGWHAIFWFTAIVGALFIVLMFVCVNESPVRTGGRFDIGGAALLSVVLTATLLVISKVGNWDILVISALALIAGGGFLAWVFLQLRVGHPMVDVRTAARRPVLLTNLASVFVTMAMFANMLLTVQHVQAPVEGGHGLGLSIIETGLVMLPSGVAMVLLAPLSGWLLNRLGGRPVLALGSFIMVGGFVFRVFLSATVIEIVIGSAIVGVGTALSFAAMPMLIMSSVPLTETASANGLNSLSRSLGTALCSALIALAVSTLSVSIEGREFLSPDGVVLCFWLASASALAGGVISLLIPRAAGSAGRVASLRGESEVLLSGRVIFKAGDKPRAPATVIFMNLDGTPVDWSRADLDGSFSAVLPNPGRYLAVANAPGWAPQTQFVEAAGPETEWNANVSQPLTLSGVVTKNGAVYPHALIAVYRASGDFITSQRCDGAGRYQVPLPPAGPYLITAFDPEGGWAHTGKTVLDIRPVVLDIEVPP